MVSSAVMSLVLSAVLFVIPQDTVYLAIAHEAIGDAEAIGTLEVAGEALIQIV